MSECRRTGKWNTEKRGRGSEQLRGTLGSVLIGFLDPGQPDTNFGVADEPLHFNEYICNELIID